MMKSSVSTVVSLCALLFSVAAASAQRMVHAGAEVGAMHSMLHTVALAAVGDSGESGKATLQQTPDGLVVNVTLTGAPGDQTAAIHKGTCDALDPSPLYPLTDVADGKSSTTLKDPSIYHLMRGTFALAVHPSTGDPKSSVACADLVLTK